MKTKLLALSSIFLLSSLGAGCSATPESYFKASARVGCKTLKKCEDELWDLAGYDKVSDCVDESLKDGAEKDFADACDDYDRGAARKCLRSGRKAKRSCETDDIDTDACSKVCGTPGAGELTPEEKGRVVAEAKFAAGEITEQELEDDLADAEFASEIEAEEEALLQEEIDAVFASED